MKPTVLHVYSYLIAPHLQTLLSLVAIALVCMAMSPVFAQTFPQMDPYSTDGSATLINYRLDTTYGATGITYDRFSDSSSKNYFGQKIARLDNGDVIVAGIVPLGNSSVANQVGLVKYSPSGRRLTWSSINPAYSRFDQYIVYPSGNSGQPTGAFIGVVGLEVHEGNIYVMANEQSTTGVIHPIIMVFATNGVFRGWWFNVPGGNANKPGRGFTISGTKLIVLGDDPFASEQNFPAQIWMSRYTINANGGLSADSNFGSGGFAFYRANGCVTVGTPVTCGTSAGFEGIKAQTGPIVFASPKFYVTASIRGFGRPSYDSVVMRFNGDGSLDTGFGEKIIAFDGGGDNADYAVALQVGYHLVIPLAYVDDIYLTVSVSRNTQRGIGVVRLNGDGDLVTSFGSGGRILFGGCGSGAGNCAATNVEEVPWSMVKDGNHLAIGGWYRGYQGASNTPVMFNYPMLVVVNSETGAIENLTGYNTGVGDATVYGVVANGDGSFTGAGDLRDASAGLNLSYFSARFQSNDVIFHNGAE